MKIYQVGGCVRDRILGLQPMDIDYVVVGGTSDEMLAAGYKQVGAGFPVFLHPETGAEYALARKERKTGIGYNGFAVEFDPSVTLEEDLMRRDLTINSMAQDMETGVVIDPYGGFNDLESRVLRHTSEAFAEDPVRVLRTARFAARYGFSIADSTLKLMRRVASELDAVPQERVWAEFQKGLVEKRAHLMIEALVKCGANQYESIKPYCAITDKLDLELFMDNGGDLITRFAVIGMGFTDADYGRCCIPNECAEMSKVLNKHLATIKKYAFLPSEERLALLERVRAFSRPEFIAKLADVYGMIFCDSWFETQAIHRDLVFLKDVDTTAIAAACVSKSDISNAIRQARLAMM